MGQQSSSPNLFDVQPKAIKSKATTQAAPAAAAVHRLIGIFRQGYERRFHEPPVILKSDGPILRGLVRQFGMEKVEQRLHAFLKWDDPFVVDSGLSLKVFHNNWNRLAARCAQQQPERKEMSVDRTASYLHSLRSVASR